MNKVFNHYTEKLKNVLTTIDLTKVALLADSMGNAWMSGKCIYLCGNGGSAGNAIHLANDFLYGAGKNHNGGLRVEALTANASVLTCLANDVGYDSIFSEQLKVKGCSDDILIVLSGSGNSPNVVKALKMGNVLKMKTFAILGFSGGECKKIAQHALHIEVNDMQIAEDMQLIIGHMCMQYLNQLPSTRHCDQ